VRLATPPPLMPSGLLRFVALPGKGDSGERGCRKPRIRLLTGLVAPAVVVVAAASACTSAPPCAHFPQAGGRQRCFSRIRSCRGDSIQAAVCAERVS
jgi:hypothetical protein